MLVWAKDKTVLDEKMKKMSKVPAWEDVEGKWRKRKEGVDEVLTAYAEAKLLHGDDIVKIQEVMSAWFKNLPKDAPAKRIRYRKVDKNGLFNDDGNLNKPEQNGARYEVLHPITKKPCAIPSGGWRYPDPADMQKLIDQDLIAFKKDHTGIPRLKTYLHEMESEVATSVFRVMGQRAIEAAEKVMGKGEFTSPKDPELLAELFNLVTWRDPQAKIFDPYGGRQPDKRC